MTQSELELFALLRSESHKAGLDRLSVILDCSLIVPADPTRTWRGELWGRKRRELFAESWGGTLETCLSELLKNFRERREP